MSSRSRSRSPERLHASTEGTTAGPHKWRQYSTPQKIALRTLVDFKRRYKINDMLYEDIFRFTDIKSHSAWTMIRNFDKGTKTFSFSDPCAPSTEDFKETRGKKRLLSHEEINAADRILRDLGAEDRKLTWKELAFELGREEVSAATWKRAIGSLSWRRCIVCSKGWQSASNAKTRVEWAQAALQARPQPENWRNIRSSNETHFGFSPDGKVHIFRRLGERYCPECIDQEEGRRWSLNDRLNAWSAIGYNFKHPLIFYDAPKNTDGQMSLPIYREHILEKEIRPWLARGDNFVLEEDSDPSHGFGTERNVVLKWKRENGLNYYGNCPASPDLALIENAWRPTKDHLRKYEHQNQESLRDGALEGWSKVTQEHINEQFDLMPKRLWDVIAVDGQFAEY